MVCLCIGQFLSFITFFLFLLFHHLFTSLYLKPKIIPRQRFPVILVLPFPLYDRALWDIRGLMAYLRFLSPITCFSYYFFLSASLLPPFPSSVSRFCFTGPSGWAFLLLCLFISLPHLSSPPLLHPVLCIILPYPNPTPSYHTFPSFLPIIYFLFLHDWALLGYQSLMTCIGLYMSSSRRYVLLWHPL